MKYDIYRNVLLALAEVFRQRGSLVYGEINDTGVCFAEIVRSLEIMQAILEDYEGALNHGDAQKEDYNL